MLGNESIVGLVVNRVFNTRHDYKERSKYPQRLLPATVVDNFLGLCGIVERILNDDTSYSGQAEPMKYPSASVIILSV